MQNQSAAGYDPLSRAFHWLTAAAVIIAFVLGPEGFGRLVRQGVDPATQPGVVWHESLGLLVLALTVLRLLWTAWRPPAPKFEMSAAMHLVAKIANVSLWALLLAQPATAFLALGSEGHPLTVLGGLRVDQMPLIAGSGFAALADWGEVHGVLGDILIWLAGLHAAAAIYHHMVLKDGVLKAMMPQRKAAP